MPPTACVPNLHTTEPARAIKRLTARQDGKDGKDKLKTAMQSSSGRVKIITFAEPLSLALPVGPVDNSNRLQLTVRGYPILLPQPTRIS